MCRGSCEHTFSIPLPTFACKFNSVTPCDSPPPPPQAPVSGRAHTTHSLHRYGSFIDSLTRAFPSTILTILLTIHFQNMFRNANGLAQMEQPLTPLQPLPAACCCRSPPCLSAANSISRFSLSTGLSAPQRSFLKKFLLFLQ